MAFGFFRKNETADVIFMGGKVFTQNTELPWVEAVACRDGLVLAVGDYEDLAELEGKNTDIVDLEGGFMLPGYIDTCGHPVMRAFHDSCLYLREGDLTDTLSQISEYVKANGDLDIIFAYGYEEMMIQGVEAEQLRTLLDETCEEKPVIVVGKSGFHCFLNTTAMNLVRAAAEEDEIQAVTLSYILGILEPIDLDTVPEAIPGSMEQAGERGFTAVFDCWGPDYFVSRYQNSMIHLYQENMMRQRFHGSLLVNCDVNPKAVMHKLSQFRTNCAELNGYVNFQTLKLVLDGNEDALSISREVLRELCIEAGDKGFDLHIDAQGEAAVSAAVSAMGAARSAGYKKNTFTLAHDRISAPEELTDTCYELGIAESVITTGDWDDEWRCIKNAKTVEEAVEMLTINAALQLGISSGFGSIEKGKHADFAIFDENPLEAASLADFKKLKAVMTVIDGEIVYES